MAKKLLSAVALSATLLWAAPVQAQDAAGVIAAASRAMGVETLKTIDYSATGFDFALGQSGVPGGPWPRFINKTYRRQVNFETLSSKVDRIRMQGENPPFGGGNQPIQGEQAQSQTIIVAQGTPWVQALELYMLPQGFLKAAATRTPTLEKQGTVNVISFRGDNGAQVRGYINAQNQAERVATMIDNAVMGDTPFEAVYLDYRTVNGVQWPMQIIQRTGGYPTFDLRLSDVKVNAPVDIQAAAPAGGGGGGGGGGQQGVPVTELAPGVLLFNSGYAVMAFDMGDHLLFLEPGNSEQRALQVIAEAKRRFPNKPVRYVVNTHTHFDHSSGLRAFVAEGATILTHEMNRGYVEELMRRQHTLAPDAQQKAPQPIKVEAVGDRKTITGNGHTIELYRMTEFGHHPAMLMAYLPQLKILYEADGYNAGAADARPPATPSPYHLALLANVQRLNLQVDRVIPVHYPADDRVVTLAEIRRMVGQGTN